MEPIAKLKSYINSAIPYAWDDSESWYEFLAKVLAKVNEIIAKTNDYFDVDIKQFVADILSEWEADGTLATVINETIVQEKANITYVDERFTEVNTTVDERFTEVNTTVDERFTEVNTTVDERFTEVNTTLAQITKQKVYLNDSMTMLEMQSEIDTLDGVGGVVELVFSKNYMFTTTLLLPNNTYVRGNDSWIVVHGDYPIFKNKNTPTCTYIEIHDFQIHDAATITSRVNYHILLENPTLSTVNNIRIYANEMTNSAVAGIHFTKRGQSAFVNKISNCVLSQASIVMETTDSWITNNTIWAYSRSFGVNVSGPSQFINNNQIVGSSVHGGIYLKDTVNGYNLELLKITDNYLDGSYDDIDSGVGIKGEYVTQSVIANNDFWRQMDEGILISSSTTLKIANNTFKDCNRRDSSKDDIHLNNTTHSNIAGNTHTRTVAHENKGKALYDNGTYNIVTGNIVFFSTNYNASEVGTTSIINNNNYGFGVRNNVKYPSKSILPFYREDLAANLNNSDMETTGGVRKVYTPGYAIRIIGLGFSLSTPRTAGSITLEIYHNNQPTGLTLSIGDGSYGKNKIFSTPLNVASTDAVSLKVSTSSDLAPLTIDINASVVCEFDA